DSVFFTDFAANAAIIDAATPASTLTVSNLTLSTWNSLELLNADSVSPLVILDNFIVDQGGLMFVLGSTVHVRSVSGGISGIDGDVILQFGGQLIATNGSLSVGRVGS